MTDEVLSVEARRLGIRLELLTVGWNAVEAVVAIAAGAAATSVALVSFGLDSIIEVSAALVVLWQFLGIAEERERRALRLIGGSFFALTAYVASSSVYDLAKGIRTRDLQGRHHPHGRVTRRHAGDRLGQATGGEADGESDPRRRFESNPTVRLPLRIHARGTRCQRSVWLAVGRSARRARHCRRRDPRRPRGMAGRYLLLKSNLTCRAA